MFAAHAQHSNPGASQCPVLVDPKNKALLEVILSQERQIMPYEGM